MTAAPPALRASSAFVFEGAASSASGTISSNVVVGDVMVLVVSLKLFTGTGVINTPAGWTPVDGPTGNLTGAVQTATFLRQAVTGDPGSGITVTGGGSQQINCAGAAYSGASPTPRDHGLPDQGGTASSSIVCAAETAAVGDLVLLVGGSRANTTGTYSYTAPGSFNIDAQQTNSGGGQVTAAFLASGLVVGSNQTITAGLPVWCQSGQIVLAPLGSTLAALGA